jgi:hypothetical protein
MLPLGLALALTATTAQDGLAAKFCSSTARIQYEACEIAATSG